MLTIDQLTPFCSRDETRSSICRPFLAGPSTVATDGRVMIRVLSVLPGAEPARFAPTAEKLAYLLSLCPQTGDWLPVVRPEAPARIPCPACGGDESHCRACHGDGRVRARFTFRDQTYSVDADCPVCDGEGACHQCDNRGTVDNCDLIRVGTGLFRTHQLHALSTLPGCEIRPAVGYEPAGIRFDGGDGCIMPCMSDEETQP